MGVRTMLRLAHGAALDAVTAEVREFMQVIDGDLDLPGYPIAVPKADTFIPQVMAASIIAKYSRDCFMKDMAVHYPEYGFERHVGYGTEEHYAALKKYGPCDLHRKSYNLHEAPSGEENETGDGKDDRTLPEVTSESAQGQRNTGGADPSVSGECKSPKRTRRKAGRGIKEGEQP
jgi:hypothetical protein